MAQKIHKDSLRYFYGGILREKIFKTQKDSLGIPVLISEKEYIDQRLRGEIPLDKRFKPFSAFDDYLISPLDSDILNHVDKTAREVAWLSVEHPESIRDSVYLKILRTIGKDGIYMMNSLDARHFHAVAVWETFSEDSALLKSGLYWEGFTKHIKTLRFPDESHLVIIRVSRAYEDVERLLINHVFIRATPDTIAPFYESNWYMDINGMSNTRVFYDFDSPSLPLEITEATEYYHELESQKTNAFPVYKLDSVKAEVIPLWQLAVEKFGLKSDD